ncbi:hypothetical protein TL16_g09654 [Triparma laevis f. inornata]|uniref:Uncharacterized protein n=1 Tax=Triparma laevis f. inornata TaxID=1714386 RepID=A0A9W7ENE3_9STRA|nr:hypothetical protein TL16_g09654 [Triparma laevis f. inornata]
MQISAAIIMLLVFLKTTVSPLSSPVPTQKAEAAARCRWRLLLNVGREEGTWMPEDWGASGSRLAIPLLVDFEATRSNLDDEMLVGRNSLLVSPASDATFINESGEQRLQVNPGGWSVEPPKEGKSPAVLRFWLDFGEGGVKRDTTLPAGKVFFTAAGWMDEEIEVGNKARNKLVELLENDILVNLKAAQADYDSSNPIAKIAKLRYDNYGADVVATQF